MQKGKEQLLVFLSLFLFAPIPPGYSIIKCVTNARMNLPSCEHAYSAYYNQENSPESGSIHI